MAASWLTGSTGNIVESTLFIRMLEVQYSQNHGFELSWGHRHFANQSFSYVSAREEVHNGVFFILQILWMVIINSVWACTSQSYIMSNRIWYVKFVWSYSTCTFWRGSKGLSLSSRLVLQMERMWSRVHCMYDWDGARSLRQWGLSKLGVTSTIGSVSSEDSDNVIVLALEWSIQHFLHYNASCTRMLLEGLQSCRLRSAYPLTKDVERDSVSQILAKNVS